MYDEEEDYYNHIDDVIDEMYNDEFDRENEDYEDETFNL